MQAERAITREDLLRGFRDVGLAEGDVLFFHSSLKSFGWVDNGADTVIDSALEAVGPEGTIVVPTFVQRVDGERAPYAVRRKAWNIGTSPSDVGHITEVLRKRPDAVRSDHCCDPMAAIGAEAATAMASHRDPGPRPSPWDEKAFGQGSPWDWLVERNALYLLMGVGFRVCSLFHYCQALWVESTFGPQDNLLMWPKVGFVPLGRRVEEEGIVTGATVGTSFWQAFRVAPCVETVARILESEPSLITQEPLKLAGH